MIDYGICLFIYKPQARDSQQITTLAIKYLLHNATFLNFLTNLQQAFIYSAKSWMGKSNSEQQSNLLHINRIIQLF